jgi:hypothetical protein
MDQSIDFRKLRSEQGGLELKPKDKLFLMVQAADRFNLEGGPHLGASDRYQLDVVTPEDLLAMLEIRELGLRARFELTLGELGQLRDSHSRESSLGPSPLCGPRRLESRGRLRQAAQQGRYCQAGAELRLLRVQRGCSRARNRPKKC